MQARVRRNGDILLGFAPEEAALLLDLPNQLRTLLAKEDYSDPALCRLLPSGSTDSRTAKEFKALIGDHILQTKLTRIDEFENSLNKAVVGKSGVSFKLDGEAYETWLGFLNDMRLLIGTTIEITDDDWEPDPERIDHLTYIHLTYIQGQLLELDPGARS